MKIEELYRKVIMEYSRNPQNFGLVLDDTYKKVHLHNPSCGDDVTMQVKLDKDIIIDIKHEGSGCSICCASASYCTIALMNKSISEAEKIFNEFYKLVKGEDVDTTILTSDALAFKGVSSFPARVRCASISWKALQEAIMEASNEKN